MGYDIFIRREPPLALDEWKAAVTGRTDVRLQREPARAKDPRTGAVIELPIRDGDAEIRVGDRWSPLFHWSDDGSVWFRVPEGFEDARSPARGIVRGIASDLRAQVTGAEGESYE